MAGERKPALLSTSPAEINRFMQCPACAVVGHSAIHLDNVKSTDGQIRHRVIEEAVMWSSSSRKTLAELKKSRQKKDRALYLSATRNNTDLAVELEETVERFHQFWERYGFRLVGSPEGQFKIKTWYEEGRDITLFGIFDLIAERKKKVAIDLKSGIDAISQSMQIQMACAFLGLKTYSPVPILYDMSNGLGYCETQWEGKYEELKELLYQLMRYITYLKDKSYGNHICDEYKGRGDFFALLDDQKEPTNADDVALNKLPAVINTICSMSLWSAI